MQKKFWYCTSKKAKEELYRYCKSNNAKKYPFCRTMNMPGEIPAIYTTTIVLKCHKNGTLLPFPVYSHADSKDTFCYYGTGS